VKLSPGLRRVATIGALSIGVGLLSIPTAQAMPKQVKDDCTDYGAVLDAPEGFIPRDDLISERKDPLSRWKQDNPAKARAAANGETVTVPVAFHVIRKNSTVAGGNIPTAWIDAQMDVLNDSFSGETGGPDSGFRFELDSVDRTTKASWFNLIPANGDERRLFRGSGKEIKMKKALHTGDADTLNVYTAKLGQFLLGWAYLPWDFQGSNPLPRFFDGVVLEYRSLPGGDLGPYDQGDTGTHEVGHWLGLHHTFQNGCESPGDFVDDTAYEASPAFQCPVGRDTCTQPGVDPITNFMDYTYDDCMYEFTSGQATRMAESWAAYR